MNLKMSILWTLAYFDIFDHPLTSFEIWKYLWSPDGSIDFEQVKSELDNLKTQETVGVKDGFYFLANRQDIILKRKISWQISKRKIDRARLMAKIFQYVPYIRGIFICNRVASYMAEAQSDIDLFIIAERERLWTVRFATLFFLKIFGLRPRSQSRRDSFCLCFFISRDDMNLQPYLLPPKDVLPDIHYIYWLSAFLSLYDGGATSDFATVNLWIKKYLPNLELTKNASISFSSRPKLKEVCEKAGDILSISNFLEKFLKKFQLKIMPQELKQAATPVNTNVVISDQALKLHLNDRRAEYRQRFSEKLQLINLL